MYFRKVCSTSLSKIISKQRESIIIDKIRRDAQDRLSAVAKNAFFKYYYYRHLVCQSIDHLKKDQYIVC